MGDPALPSPRAANPADFLVLGELSVRVAGRVVALPGPALRSVLGILLVGAGDVVREDRLLDLGWGTGRGTRRALQCAVNRLRDWLAAVAGDQVRVDHTGVGYRMVVAADSVDLGRFRGLLRARPDEDAELRLRRLVAALRQWRGPVLGGGAEWLAGDPVVGAIERDRVACAGAAADLACVLHRAPEVLADIEAVASAAPYDEPLQARLVRLLARSGRHAEAVRQVQLVRSRLRDDLGIAPSQELRSAHAAALPAERTAPIPAQLPAAVADFVGRPAELSAVCDLLLTGRGPALLAVNGPPGVGKSAFAVHVAHQLSSRFFDGQLYADLRATPTTEVLAGFVRALGGEPPAAHAERVAMYRSLTAGRRMLVLLDDAADEARVAPLVPGAAGCAVLVTARPSLAGLPGVRLLRLPPLSEEDGVRLLSAVAGRDLGDAANEIVRLCDGLPLAVRIAGARLAARPTLGAARLADQLRAENLDALTVRGLTLRAALRSGLTDLAPADAAVFPGLADLPDDFPAGTAAERFGLAAEVARDRLEALVDVGLLDAVDDDNGEPRYRVTRLVRIYAAERARLAG